MTTLLIFLAAAITLFEGAVDANYGIRLEGYDGGAARVLLVDRSNPSRSWEIGRLEEGDEAELSVDRTDKTSMVLSRRTEYGIYEGSIKLFFNVSAKRVTKRINFNSEDATRALSLNEALRAGIPNGVFREVKLGKLPLLDPDHPVLPTPMAGYPLPQSTFADFSNARRQRVRDGYDARSHFSEQVGAYQVDADRVWFGKNFYDGEGYSGIGAIGYFDTRAKRYMLLRIPEVVDWSVSAIRVERGIVWAGLVQHPEGADRSGGLLRYETGSGSSRVYRIADVIHTIARSGDEVFMGTTNGIYVLSGERLTRHRAEPDVTGRIVLFTEEVR